MPQDEFKRVTEKQAQEFAAAFFGEEVKPSLRAADEFVFERGVVKFKVFNFYGREGEYYVYPCEYPFGQVTINDYVIAGVLFAKVKGKNEIRLILND